MEGGFLLTLKNLYEDKEIVDAVPVVELAPQALAKTVPRPISAYYSDMSLEMSEQFSQVYKCDVSPEDAVKLVQESLQQIAEAAS
jgi:multiple sugar transport system substrate-binding protein